jgi:hypothetical protein
MEELTYDEALALIRNRFDDGPAETDKWWHSHNEETCLHLFQQALEWGLTPDRAVQLIGGGFGAGCDEHGA